MPASRNVRIRIPNAADETCTGHRIGHINFALPPSIGSERKTARHGGYERSTARVVRVFAEDLEAPRDTQSPLRCAPEPFAKRRFD